MNFLIDGLDRLGKDSLIRNIQVKLGYHTVIHKSKPVKSLFYNDKIDKFGKTSEFWYQHDSFSNDIALLKQSSALNLSFIFNRTWIGEAVYSNLYRGYDGNYVFDLEKNAGLHSLDNVKLILLTEDFSVSKHFVSDGDSFDDSKRQQEQNLFIEAFNKSIIKNKKIVCVTDPVYGTFRRFEDILDEVV